MQKKVITGLIDNMLAKKPKSRSKILIEAGYTKSTASQSQKVVNAPAVALAVQEAMEKYQRLRDKAAYLAFKKADTASFPQLVNAMDIAQKNMNLLGGKSTENVAIQVTISEAIANKNQ